eukprot:Partr_v1_DN26459_c1_g1_i2_m23571
MPQQKSNCGIKRSHIGILLATFIAVSLLQFFRPVVLDNGFNSARNSKKVETGAIAQPRPNNYTHREFVARRLWGFDPQPEYWPSYFDKLDSEKLAPLTAETQKWIYDRLHPKNVDCKTQKYLSYGQHHGGLGSMVHVATAFLAHALEKGAMFVWHPTEIAGGSMYADSGCGRNEKYSNFLCFFKQPSACGFDHVTAENLHPNPGEDRGAIPSHLEARLRSVYSDRDLTGDFVRFWWRAQGAAYLMRLNAPTLETLQKMRMDKELNEGVVISRDGKTRKIPVPFPLPSGTIHAHVRHGDKDTEMELVAFPAYIAKAEQLVAENPLGYFKTMFVSTEDQGVIDTARKLLSANPGTTPNLSWTMFTCNIHRINGSPYEQLDKFGKSQMTHEWLHQLLMSLEGDIEISTLGSNWSRLLNELKCVWVDKCHMPYFEVGTAASWSGYSW